MTPPPVTRPYVDLSGFRRSLDAFNIAMGDAGRALRPALEAAGHSMDTLRYRILVTNLMRTRTFEEATAIVNLRKARAIRNGARRHGRVKHARDELRHARRVANQ